MYNHLCLRDLVLTEKFLDTRTEAVTKAVCFNVGALAVQLPELHGTRWKIAEPRSKEETQTCVYCIYF